MIVNFCFDDDNQDIDLVDLPESIIDDLEQYQNDFFAWLFNKENNHKYWVCQDGEKKYCSYRSDAFIEWLNYFILQGQEKAKVIKTHSENSLSQCPMLNF